MNAMLDFLEMMLVMVTIFTAIIILPLFLFRLLGLLLGAPL